MGGEYIIVDMIFWLWLWVIDGFYGVGEYVDFDSCKNVWCWMDVCMVCLVSEKVVNIFVWD